MPSMITGSTVVTYIQTKAKKIVLPMAIFFIERKKDCGSLGAEYKKVTKAPKDSTIQYCLMVIKKTIEPASPAKYKKR